MSNPAIAEETIALPMPASSWSRTVRVIGSEAECPPLRLIALPAGTAFEIRQSEVIIGRHGSADVQLLQPDVSRRHCRLAYGDQRWVVEDLGSINGTLVNGEQVERVVLHSNDVLRIGGSLFQVEIEAAAVAVPILSVGENAERSRNILRSIAALLTEGDAPVQRRKSA